MATIEVTLRDEQGNVIGSRTYPMELGQQTLHEIEGEDSRFKQQALPEIEQTLLEQAQTAFTQEKKKTTPIVCNGKTPVQIKTIHGVFSFEVQRYRLNDEATNYFDWTEQFPQGYSSQRLQEYVAYYSNRMSYEEVEKLVARHQGKPILSDQGIWNLVTNQASGISDQIAEEVKQILEGHNPDSLQVNSNVDIYDSSEREILIFDDGIQVKGQQENRHQRSRNSGDEYLPSEESSKATKVITDVVLMEKSTGEFEYIVAPLAAQDNPNMER